MVRRFFAITLFISSFAVSVASALPAKANDFTDHFTLAKPPATVPMFTFEDAKGQILDLKDFRGRYVLLNVWATWCGPCVKEMPSLDSLARKLAADAEPAAETKPITISTRKTGVASIPFHSKMEIVPVTEDHEGLSTAEGFYKRHNLHHLKIFVDTTGRVPSILEVNGLPTTLLIDPDGKEIGRIEGSTEWDDPETVAYLEAQMKSAIK